MSNQTIEDLWPSLNEEAAVATPSSILKTQATLLSQKTAGRLRGKVETLNIKNAIHHRFLVVVPALDDYQYALFEVHHDPIRIYPVFVDYYPGPSSKGFDKPQLGDEAQFMEWLRGVLGAQETLRIVQNLLAQARG